MVYIKHPRNKIQKKSIQSRSRRSLQLVIHGGMDVVAICGEQQQQLSSRVRGGGALIVALTRRGGREQRQ
jgi:hypothetical protein